jgi:hypothetical protein
VPRSSSGIGSFARSVSPGEEAGAFTGAPGAAGIVPDVCLAGVVSAMGEDGCAVVV